MAGVEETEVQAELADNQEIEETKEVAENEEVEDNKEAADEEEDVYYGGEDEEEEKAVKLGSRTFRDKHSLVSCVHSLLYNFPLNEKLEQSDVDLLVDLLKQGHENPDGKIGSGVESISVKMHPVHTEVRCFMIARTDGTEEDFSYRKCVQKLFGEDSPKRVDKKRKREVEFKQGVLVKFSDLPENTTREDIKDHLARFGTVYLNFTRNNADGFAEFQEAEHAQNAVKTLTSEEFKVKDKQVTLTLVDGDAEKAYWEEKAEARRLNKTWQNAR
eukprot:Colp12_sorted_trinity150504_noHs@35809